MNKKGATPEERDACLKLYRKFGEVMEHEDYDTILNTLCFIIGDLGVDLNTNKRTFIALVVEQVSSAYDLAFDNREKH